MADTMYRREGSDWLPVTAVSRIEVIQKDEGGGLQAEAVCLLGEDIFGCTSINDGAVLYGKPLTLDYAAKANFTLPGVITVYMGGEELIQGTDYTWSHSTGRLSIPLVSGNIEVAITAYIYGGLYTECEYIESSGTQYIDTGVIADQNTAMEAVFSKTPAYYSAYWAVFGACQQDLVRSFLFAMHNNGNTKCHIQAGTNKSLDINYSFAADTRYTAKLDKRVLYINGASVGTLTSYTYSTPVNIGIFRQLSSVSTNCGNAHMRLYGAKLWQSGLPVRNLVPCVRNSDNAAGLYDEVSEAFFANAGTGVFSYGSDYVSYIANTLFGCSADEHRAYYIGSPAAISYMPDNNFALPDNVTVTMDGLELTQGIDFTWTQSTGELYIPNISGDLDVIITAALDGVDYTQCDYIQSSGTQYIDTGVTGDTNTVMEATFAKIATYPSGYWAVFGACQQDMISSFLFAMYNNGNTKCNIQAGTNKNLDISYTFTADTQYTAYLNKRVLYINGTSVGSLSSYTYTTPVNLGLFRKLNSVATNCSNAHMKLYSAKIWQSSDLVRSFIPCVRNADGAAGLYEAISGEFYGNAGSGAFGYG